MQAMWNLTGNASTIIWHMGMMWIDDTGSIY